MSVVRGSVLKCYATLHLPAVKHTHIQYMHIAVSMLVYYCTSVSITDVGRVNLHVYHGCALT